MTNITFPDARDWQGVYEAEPYRGNAVSAAEFSVERSRLLDDDNRLAHRINGQEIRIGRMFVRRQHQYDPETSTFLGQPATWQLIPEDIYRTGVICVVSRDASADPGQPMRDPLGNAIIVDEDGDGTSEGRPDQPLVGQQARGRWDGKLLWEDEAETVPKIVI